jgi:GcrA cell cycle regulator
MSLTHEAAAPSPYRNGLNTGWTEERVERLKKLLADDLSAAQMADALGGVTRNAVIGKLTRLGLAPGRVVGRLRHKAAMALRPPRDPNAPRPIKARKGGARSALFSYEYKGTREQGSNEKREARAQKAADLRARFEVVEIVDLPAEESAVAVGLMKLNAHTCRWPLGDPRDLDAMRFCGAEPFSRPGRDYPYCARHCRMAYQGRR